MILIVINLMIFRLLVLINEDEPFIRDTARWKDSYLE